MCWKLYLSGSHINFDPQLLWILRTGCSSIMTITIPNFSTKKQVAFNILKAISKNKGLQ